MPKQVKLEVIQRLLDKGLIFEAEVACLELHVSPKNFKELRGGDNAD